MIKLARTLAAVVLPRRLIRRMKEFFGRLTGWGDRLCFPFWLWWQCARARRRAVLVWRTAALGDVVCTLPLLGAIRERHPGCLLIYITLRGIKPLVLLSQEVDRVYGIDHVYGRPSWLPLAAPLSFGCIEKIYEPRIWDERGDAMAEVHLVDDMAAFCGITPLDRQPHLYPSPDLIAHTLALYQIPFEPGEGRLLVAINGGHTWPVREWQVEKWQALVDALHREYDVTIIQLGVRSATPPPDAYDELKGVHSLVGRLHSDQLTALIAACDLVISIDSGPVHIAGAVGTPVVGLFGAVNPAYRLPPASPALAVFSDVPCLFCHHRIPAEHWRSGCPYDIRCMKELTVEAVLVGARKLLFEENPESSKASAAGRPVASEDGPGGDISHP